MKKVGKRELEFRQNRDNNILAPPVIPIVVHCTHCGEVYMSDKMHYGLRFAHVLWWCKNETCTAHGFGHDVVPFAPKI